MKIVDLNEAHVREHLAAYIAVSCDVSDWGAPNFLSYLPGKWELSFALWEGKPVAYCVLSRKFGPPHIHQFMVTREMRGNGIGTTMMSEAVSRGAKTLKVDHANAGAIRFYQRHGWISDRQEGRYLWLRVHLTEKNVGASR